MLSSRAHAVSYSVVNLCYEGRHKNFDNASYLAGINEKLKAIREMSEQDRSFIAIIHPLGVDWYFNADVDALIKDEKKRIKVKIRPYKDNCVKDTEVSIADLPKISLLKALYRQAQKEQGMGILQNSPLQEALTDDEARAIIGLGRVDHINGIAMRMCIGGDFFRTYVYNSFNGENAAEEVIEALRASIK